LATKLEEIEKNMDKKFNGLEVIMGKRLSGLEQNVNKLVEHQIVKERKSFSPDKKQSESSE